jgi:hypothetical protein
MGRLTLNVLLSFAQFEREVTGERIRDKIAASKRKGLWMGGFVPFGYRAKDRTLAIDKDEAELVRTIFARYLELGTVARLEAELARLRLRTRPFTSASKKAWGNRPFSRGHLYKILSNPIYAGKIAHKGELYDGQHAAIIDRKTWDAVQAQLATNGRQHNSALRAKEPSPLAGLLVGAKGRKLTCSHAVKDGKRYRYYVGTHIEQGQPKPWRLPAHDLERVVFQALQSFLTDRQRITDALASSSFMADELNNALWTAKQLAGQIKQAITREKLLSLLKEVHVSETTITLDVRLAVLTHDAGSSGDAIHQLALRVALRRRAGETAIMIENVSDQNVDRDPALIKAIARGFTWFQDLATGRAETVAAIAKREGVTDRYVSQLIQLAFLSPAIVEDALRGRATVGLSTKKLLFETELSMLWLTQQRQVSSVGFGGTGAT